MIILNTARYGIFFLVLIALQGCISYKIPTSRWVDPSTPSSQQQEVACQHWLYQIIPRHRSQIQWFDLGHWIMWSIFGNDDDGIFGEGPKAHYKQSQKPSFKKGLYWFARNPFHNFCFYVIGSAHRDNSKFTIIEISSRGIKCLAYCPLSKETFPDNQSCFAFVFNGGKPFVATRLKLNKTTSADFYLGWRSRGNFGLKLKREKHSAEKVSHTVPTQ